MLHPQLGAVTGTLGTTFTVFSASATAIDVCLLHDGPARRDGMPAFDEVRVPLQPVGGHLWSASVPQASPGMRYGYRVTGPYDPRHGQRHDPAKLLVDPYAKQLCGGLTLHDDLLAHARDSGPYVPHSVIREPLPAASRREPVPWADTTIYELHVRGFTRRHPGVPEALRGSYAGLASPASLEHLTSLGITTVELLPVHSSVSEVALLQRGLTNYWGYNTLNFFAPNAAYAATADPVIEFRDMVQALHAAGLEVVLDVVYNHTAEGDASGPTLCYRGLDNATYYRLRPGHPRLYQDTTGCGNTLDLRSPIVLQLVLDSLRYWAGEMGVDGFRFDLAPALLRGSAFLATVGQDPLLRQVKLIAEPWDLGEDGYQLGAFPAPWAEWNGRFRDTVRDAWRGAKAGVADLGYRLTGSSDLFDHDGRSPLASVNFVTSHDGFTLADLVSYARKHNEANGEANEDGETDTRSVNCGTEGVTEDPAVLAARRRIRRAHLATLLLSTGAPMLLAGDEFGRTQHGNNNAYCQDNEISWVHWPPPVGGSPGSGDDPAGDDPAGDDPYLLDLIRGLLALRRGCPLLHRSRFFAGGPSGAGALADITWLRADGQQMTEADWASPEVRTLQAVISDPAAPAGTPTHQQPLLLVAHPQLADASLTLPSAPWAMPGTVYELLLDTAADDLAGFPGGPHRMIPPGQRVPLVGSSVHLYRICQRRD